MLLPPKVIRVVLQLRGLMGFGGERAPAGAEPAHAFCAGTLDQMVDQVARSIVFVQKRYPRNE